MRLTFQQFVESKDVITDFYVIKWTGYVYDFTTFLDANFTHFLYEVCLETDNTLPPYEKDGVFIISNNNSIPRKTIFVSTDPIVVYNAALEIAPNKKWFIASYHARANYIFQQAYEKSLKKHKLKSIENLGYTDTENSDIL